MNKLIFTVLLTGLIFGCQTSDKKTGNNQKNASRTGSSIPDVKIIFADSWETGCWHVDKISGSSEGSCQTGPTWKQSQMQGDYSGQVVKSPVMDGKNAMRFEWRNEGNCPDNNYKKAHLNAHNFASATTDHWASFSVYFPEEGMENDSEPEIIAQWHGEPNDSTCGKDYPTWTGCGPYLSLSTKNDHLFVGWKGSSKKCLNCTSNQNRYADIEHDGMKDLGVIEKNQWTHFVFHVKPDFNGHGVLQVWKDGVQVVNKADQILGYNDEKGGYVCIGIYKYTCRSDRQKRVVYFDNFILANKTAALADF